MQFAVTDDYLPMRPMVEGDAELSAEVVVKKILILLAAGALMAACSESPMAPEAAKKVPATRNNDDPPTCPFGYEIAYNPDTGQLECVPQ